MERGLDQNYEQMRLFYFDLGAKKKEPLSGLLTRPPLTNAHKLTAVTIFPPALRCQEKVSQGCKTKRFRLKPSSLASVKVNYWKIAVGQGVKEPYPDIFW